MHYLYYDIFARCQCQPHIKNVYAQEIEKKIAFPSTCHFENNVTWKEEKGKYKRDNKKWKWGDAEKREEQEFLNLSSYFHHLNVTDLTSKRGEEIHSGSSENVAINST